jgi:hypothetical protein
MSRITRIAAVLGGVIAFALGPHVGWWLTRSRSLKVVIVDKTVPFRNYREHAAIPWILHAMKVRAASGGFLDPAHDYLGFDPATRTGHDVTDGDLASADTLVVTDTYGVYAGDYENPDEHAALERSEKIYGGLSYAEATTIEAFSARGGMVVAEFNTFASPTESAARTRLEGLFGVRWTRWVVRHWPDLQDANEVPRWVGATYARVYHASFEVTGAGLVFVHEDGDIVVLRDGEDLDPEVLTQERTPTGAEFGLPERGAFRYWIDVIEPNGADVLYEHVVHTTSAGNDKLAAHGLSPRFPALTRRGASYYFAGDFADSSLDLGSPERAWLLGYRRARANGCGSGGRDESSFWGFYVPILERLLASRAR